MRSPVDRSRHRDHVPVTLQPDELLAEDGDVWQVIEVAGRHRRVHDDLERSLARVRR
jgi:hypothetical protein